ncbi:nucleotidyltransferase [candidate division KSB1 bacterium]|nr:nucleotidyltransferase [candidate division KSB1 bacterium]
MNNQFNEFLKLLKALEAHQVEYVLIGGVAVIIHGMERLTRDIGLFIQNTPANIRNLQKALQSLYHDDSINEITVSELEMYSVIRYGTPGDFYIDIITRLGEAIAFEEIKYEIIEYEGIGVKIASPESLYLMKKNTYREKDKLDIIFLQELMRARNTNKE